VPGGEQHDGRAGAVAEAAQKWAMATLEAAQKWVMATLATKAFSLMSSASSLC
jgi:hypothetical protein